MGEESKHTIISPAGFILVTIGAIAAIWISSIVSSRNHRTLGPHPRTCQRNLNNIGMAMICYQSSNNDAMPFDYKPLIDTGFASQYTFSCPTYLQNAGREESPLGPDYIMIECGFIGGASDINVFELPINHNQAEAFYLTCSGGIECVKNPDMHEFAAAVQDVNNLLGKLRNNP